MGSRGARRWTRAPRCVYERGENRQGAKRRRIQAEQGFGGGDGTELQRVCMRVGVKEDRGGGEREGEGVLGTGSPVELQDVAQLAEKLVDLVRCEEERGESVSRRKRMRVRAGRGPYASK